MSRKRRKRIVCPNCDTPLKEQMNFCPECGQENHIKRVSLKVVFEDFFKTYFTYDSKLLVTLKNLILKPSFLSKAYLQGKMVSYLPPIRLYIFISFIFFLVFNLTSSGFFSNFNINDDGVEFKNLKVDQNNQAKNGVSYAKIAKLVQQIVDNKAKQDEVEGNEELRIDLPSDLENKVLNRFTKEHEIKAFVAFVKSKLPIVFFILIPLFALLYFMFFYKRDLFYVDHLVFVLHIQSFLFLALTIEAILCWIVGIDSIIIFPFLILIYIIFATKRFFNKKWWGTVWRLGIMSFIYSLLTILLFTGYFIVALQYF